MTSVCTPTGTITALPTPFDYDCPAWCERTDHHADVVGPNDPPNHYGPDFGRHIWVQGTTGDPNYALVDLAEGMRMDGAALRQLAANALAAAEWLEAQS